MQSSLRNMFELVSSYIVGAVASFGWILFGIYVYSRPVPSDAFFEPDLNHDIGSALMAQGLIFFVTFLAAALVRYVRGNKEQEEMSKDRQMIREIHAWITEQKSNHDVSV